MTDSTISRAGSEGSTRPSVDRPIAAVAPGVVLVALGLWIVTDGGPLALGWSMFAIGSALLLIGTIAWGVAWGLDLHNDR